MEKRLYFLSGLPDSDKTDTLRLLYKRLTGQVAAEEELYKVLRYRGLNIGFLYTSGCLEDIHRPLQQLVVFDCGIILCIARQRSQVRNYLWVEMPKAGYRVELVCMRVSRTRVTRAAERERVARLLQAYIESARTGLSAKTTLGWLKEKNPGMV